MLKHVMQEVKGRLETKYVWTCESCGLDNEVVDDKRCIVCDMEATNYKRHFKLTPTPMKLGWLV